MITKTRCLFYEVDGQFYKSLEEAQAVDLKKLMVTRWGEDNGEKQVMAEWLLQNKDAITCILTTTPRSRAKARKANGATRKRTPKKVPQPALVTP
jgi:hypothetical protein